MAVPVTIQKDLVGKFKREISLNAEVLNKIRPMSPELSRLIFKENALEKPTQNMFNHFSYYLVSIIDFQTADKFLWPLYDSKTEKTYRSMLSAFINDYSSQGLLSPVMSSYLVNPGCYKVTKLLFQMTQLAVQHLLLSKMSKESEKDLYKKVTEKYKINSDDFVEEVIKEVEAIPSNLYRHQRKRLAMENIASILREKIVSMEEKLTSLNAQKFIDNLVDNYVKENSLDEATKTEVMKIKNVKKPAPFFDIWLEYVDENVKNMDSKWDEKVTPFLEICTDCQKNTSDLIARHTGEADCNSYMIEYNHLTDEICTDELENQVNSQQKYILKNIVRNERLYFPNLIRGFLISICYILKNNEIGDEIYKFNEYLDNGHRNWNELILAMRMLNNRVMNAEAKLQPSQSVFNQSVSLKEFEIPPLPDLSGLKANRDNIGQTLIETFTPLSMSKHQFNLHRKHNSFSFSKPQAKALITPFHQGPRDSFLNSLISCRVSTYDRPNVSTNFNNISVISQANSRGNETIAECSAGFTKQQIMRLLSAKKSSSSKKFKHSSVRPNINIKKGGLFNESDESSSSIQMFRSYSSPNLYENREKKCFLKTGRRKLSIMQEGSSSLLEVSGIAALEKDDTYGTPEGVMGSKKTDAASVPVIVVTQEKNVAKVFKEIEEDLNKEIEDQNFLNKEITNECSALKSVERNRSRKSFENNEESKTETPKTDAQLIRKTSSLEKIINRFKKVRANVMPPDGKDEESNFMTIAEEKENENVNDVLTVNRILLPDLLSPSLSIKSSEYLDQLCSDVDDSLKDRKPRQSLGTVLGVDNTFLDQFDLID
ncbi:unnamed protein product [Chilo suppressalis]|uniref:HAUS augmin-like complex subunit 6 N-terminal domain-containing protein n=1 Tax=Chilo suppressalis TaxID=168631 RepID=A0ABN8B7V4_CHISP|nr:unnamed protein product [Chilo suppressalis]